MKELKYWIWLSRIENINKKIILKLLEKYKTPETIWNITKQELISLGISTKNADRITDIRYKQNLDKFIDYMSKNNIEILTLEDESYPKSLKEIYDSPISIYVKGNKEILNERSIAIIGCRQASKYGEKVAKEFAYNLSKHNINIISGGARGIDTYSHIGSIMAKGKTISVVGCGLDRIYPPENRKLFDKIIDTGGIIVSEYTMGTPPLQRNFPERNRIISGISNGILVVEAKEKSGTLITVDFALEHGKDVYVIPGNIDNPNSYGTNELIKQGAKLITKVEEILEEL